MTRFNDRSFFLARLISYSIIFFLLVASYVLPDHYLCEESVEKCFACGTRTGIMRLLCLDIIGAINANPLSILIAVCAMLALSDCLVALLVKLKNVARVR